MYAVLFLLVVILARGGGGGHGGHGGGGGRGGRGGFGRAGGRSLLSGKGLGKSVKGGTKGLDKAHRSFANSVATKAAQRDFSRVTGGRLSPGQRAILEQHRPSFEKYSQQILEKGRMTHSAHEQFWKKELGTSKYQAVERPLTQMHRESSNSWLKDFKNIYDYSRKAVALTADEEDDDE